MYFFKNILICIVSCILISCNNKKTSSANSNPYNDDYSKISTLAQRDLWNGANMQDPSCIKVEDTYYLYSSNFYFIPPNTKFKNDSSIHMGLIPCRSSKDLVHWKFEGWAFDSIPQEAYNKGNTENKNNPPENIRSPFIYKTNNEFRLYYSVSYQGINTSCIGLATSNSPIGPWNQKGIVLTTSSPDKMNAIDPSVIKDEQTGKEWMMYGSYYDGLYCLELNSHNGLSLHSDDKGVCIARRADAKSKIMEAPEITYNKELGMYYLFLSYDAPFTNYNLRVGRSKNPTGPFLDYFGNDLRDTTDNYPLLTYNYMFNNHPGWSDNAHCCILKDENTYYAFHQGRLAPGNQMLQLHCREIKWLKNGWPVFSPERYATFDSPKYVHAEDLFGNWEIILMHELVDNSNSQQEQVQTGVWKYDKKAFNSSELCSFTNKLSISAENDTISNFTKYKYIDATTIELTDSDNKTFECKIFNGWDWENQKATILFSGINNQGLSVWGKKI